jgi:GT2 family glycosyltransferase/glycosyltransferase involved in cell wall biosynthesis
VDTVQTLRQAMASNPFMAGNDRSTDVPIVVVVPIYNAAADLVRCLESVVRETSSPFRLVLINDGSTDQEISPILDGLRCACPGLTILDRRDNRGFVRTVNQGFALSTTADVVILNSDTIVSRGWLAKMTEAARSRPDVATVTPLTNNGTLCSIPNPFEDNDIPPGYGVQSFADLVENTSLRLFPRVPTGVGFCMLVTRRALAAVGGFDAETFGIGYGEENDFCQRAIRAGLVNVIADHAFVYHKGRASFGVRSKSLLTANLDAVSRKYPGYDAEVEHLTRAHPLAAFHERIRARIARRRTAHAVRLRVLHILHRGGGTEKHATDLASMVDPTILSYVLTSDGRNLDVDEYHAGGRLRSLRFPLPSTIGRYGPLRDAGYRDVLTTICSTLEVGLIHVHHLIYNTLDIADVAAAFGIPYVMTLHDYHTVCQMYTLLDPAGDPCGACLLNDARSVEACMNHAGHEASYLAEYQVMMSGFLTGAAHLFVPSSRARDIVAGRFPTPIHDASIIEHGHRRCVKAREDPAATQPVSTRDGGRSSLHVAVIGGLDVHKGSAVFRDLLKANEREDTTFHFYGTTSDTDITQGPRDRLRRLHGARFVYHGPYDSRDIVGLLIADGIDVGLQLSIWPETFSYTVSEFADAGIPVIAGALGAQGERVERHRLGWTVPDIRDPHETLAILDSIAADPLLLTEIRRQMNRDEALPSHEAVWQQYVEVYMTIAPAGRVPARQDSGNPPPVIDRECVASLAAALSDAAQREQPTHQLLAQRDAELEAARLLLRSPRHRIADAIAGAIQKIPIVWPALARVTDAVLRMEQRRSRQRSKSL